jgi:hypothetical protein
VRVRATCSRGASAVLKLRTDDSGIETEFEVDNNRRGTVWNVALVHERRRVWSGNRRTGGPSGSFTVRRTIPNFPGADEVFARAIGPRGVTCRATAVMPG